MVPLWVAHQKPLKSHWSEMVMDSSPTEASDYYFRSDRSESLEADMITHVVHQRGVIKMADTVNLYILCQNFLADVFSKMFIL